MAIYFTSGNSKIWGLQYHPDYEYWQMINLSNARKDKIIQNNHFKTDADFQKHLNFLNILLEKCHFYLHQKYF